jgi:hypothetical protein
MTETILDFRFWILDFKSSGTSPVFQDGASLKYVLAAHATRTAILQSPSSALKGPVNLKSKIANPKLVDIACHLIF